MRKSWVYIKIVKDLFIQFASHVASEVSWNVIENRLRWFFIEEKTFRIVSEENIWIRLKGMEHKKYLNLNLLNSNDILLF